MAPRHIVIVGYDNITSLDLSGPLEAFSSAFIEDSRGQRRPCYKVTIAALGAKTFRSESGLRMTATCFLSSLRHLDAPHSRWQSHEDHGCQSQAGKLDQSPGERHPSRRFRLHRGFWGGPNGVAQWT